MAYRSLRQTSYLGFLFRQLLSLSMLSTLCISKLVSTVKLTYHRNQPPTTHRGPAAPPTRPACPRYQMWYHPAIASAVRCGLPAVPPYISSERASETAHSPLAAGFRFLHGGLGLRLGPSFSFGLHQCGGLLHLGELEPLVRFKDILLHRTRALVGRRRGGGGGNTMRRRRTQP